MTPAKLSDLIAVLDALEIPWANTLFEPEEAVEPPFIVLVADTSVDYEADNGIYAQLMGYEIEFYSVRRDYAMEKRIQNALDAAGIVYSKSVWYIESEDMTETAYGVTVYED